MKLIELDWAPLKKVDEVIEKLEPYPHAQILAKLMRLAVRPESGLTGRLMYGEGTGYYGTTTSMVFGPAIAMVGLPHPSEATATLKLKVVIPKTQDDVNSDLYFYRYLFEYPSMARRLDIYEALPRLTASDSQNGRRGGIALEQFSQQQLIIETCRIYTDQGLEVKYSRWLLEKIYPELSRLGSRLIPSQEPIVIEHDAIQLNPYED